jgi:dihydrofolate reductase
MTINIVVAISSNYVIGENNKLLWHLPNDLKHLNDIIYGNTVIMGRKTFDSIESPITNSRNIIITHQNIQIEGCEVVHSISDALALSANEDEVFILGGADIYRQSLPITDRIYLTIVHHQFDGDTFFPEIDFTKWVETEHEDHQPDEKNKLPYSFITLERA